MDDEVEPYSEVTQRRLEEATATLIERLRQYTLAVSGLSGRTTERAALWGANDDIAEAIASWNARALYHTGTSPLRLPLDDDEDEAWEDDEEEAPVAIEGQLSVVSRWDLVIADTDALIAAGRAAHRRLRPEETEEDATMAVSNLGIALYSIAHEMPVPWHHVEGVVGAVGAVAYIVPDQPLDPPSDGEEPDIPSLLEAPSGEVLFLETWS